jgi:hypothetical protein
LISNILNIYNDYHHREISGHQVISAISLWNGKGETIKVSEVREIIFSIRILLKTLVYLNFFYDQNGELLWREFLFELLTFEGNEATSFLPDDLKNYLLSINEKII